MSLYFLQPGPLRKETSVLVYEEGFSSLSEVLCLILSRNRRRSHGTFDPLLVPLTLG